MKKETCHKCDNILKQNPDLTYSYYRFYCDTCEMFVAKKTGDSK